MIYDFLNAKHALIWRIVHCDNMPWLIQNGLHCANTTVQSNNWITIGNTELINRRSTRQVPIGNEGTLSDYVPFYFTPFSPMLLNIHTGYEGITKVDNTDIVILVASLYDLQASKIDFVFTDRHAYMQYANFYNDLAHLNEIDWDILQKRDFRRDNNDPQKVERYQAEALIYQYHPIDQLKAIVCYSEAVQSKIQGWLNQYNLNVKVVVRSEWYF
jgi:hypothetical protein